MITCVSDNEGFAAEVYDYLYSVLEKQAELKEGKGIRVDRKIIVLVENEVRIDHDARIPKDMVKWALESFLRQNREKLSDYDLIEFGDTLTIGKILPLSKMEMATCEICGYFTPYPEEIQTHRMTHFGP